MTAFKPETVADFRAVAPSPAATAQVDHTKPAPIEPRRPSEIGHLRGSRVADGADRPSATISVAGE